MSYSEYNTYPVQVPLMIQWGEMDAFQHVNNIIYFRYFETARIAYFQKMGIIGDDPVGPILAKTSCKFIFPLSFPDQIVCTANVTDVGIDRFSMEYHVFSMGKERLAAKGTGIVVSYDYQQNKKVDLPSKWIQKINELEQF